MRVSPRIPEGIFGRSLSLRGVAVLSLPGARRAICASTASRSIFSPAGNPSITTPIPPPWLSPNTEIFILSPYAEDILYLRKFSSAADFRVILEEIRVALVYTHSVGALDFLSCARCADRSRHHYSVVAAALSKAAVELADARDFESVGQLLNLAAEGIYKLRRGFEPVAFLDAQAFGACRFP